MSERVRGLLRDRFEPRRNVLRGTVTSAPLVEGRSAGYVVVNLAGQAGVTVRCNPDQQPPLAPGDTIDALEFGSPSAAFYVAQNRVAGARASSGWWEFSQDTRYNGDDYQAGDQLLGSTLPGCANWKYVYAFGHWLVRSAHDVHGAIGNLQSVYGYEGQTFGVAWGRPDGEWVGIDEEHGIRMMRQGARLAQWREDTITLGQDGQPQLRLAPGAIEFLGADGAVAAGFDGVTRSVFGFDRWGRPLGPSVEIGPTDDGRFGLWVRGANNVPFAALLSGTASAPDDARFRFGAQGAADYLEFADGELEIGGVVRARGGVIGGFTIEGDRLSGSGMIKLSGDVPGKRVILDANQSAYPISAGSDSPASGSFRVGWFGDVWCSKINLLSGTATATGFIIDINNNNTGAGHGAIKGQGDAVGVFGYGNKYGVQGQAVGGTGAAGVYGSSSGAYAGVHGYGEPGVMAEANGAGADALRVIGGPLNANGQDVKGVNRLYFDATHYLYQSGNDVYWFNGTTGVKLN